MQKNAKLDSMQFQMSLLRVVFKVTLILFFKLKFWPKKIWRGFWCIDSSDWFTNKTPRILWESIWSLEVLFEIQPWEANSNATLLFEDRYWTLGYDCNQLIDLVAVILWNSKVLNGWKFASDRLMSWNEEELPLKWPINLDASSIF